MGQTDSKETTAN